MPGEEIMGVSVGLCWQVCRSFLGPEEITFPLLPGQTALSDGRQCISYHVSYGEIHCMNDVRFVPITIGGVCLGVQLTDLCFSWMEEKYVVQPGELSLYMEVKIKDTVSGKITLHRFFSRHFTLADSKGWWQNLERKPSEAIVVSGAVRPSPLKKTKTDDVAVIARAGIVHLRNDTILTIIFNASCPSRIDWNSVNLTHAYGDPFWDRRSPNCVHFNGASGEKILPSMVPNWEELGAADKEATYCTFMFEKEEHRMPLVLSYRLKDSTVTQRIELSFDFCISCASCRTSLVDLRPQYERYVMRAGVRKETIDKDVAPPPLRPAPKPLPIAQPPPQDLPKPVRLFNLGNTCFMNATLQVLFNNVRVANILAHSRHEQSDQLFRSLLATFVAYRAEQFQYRPHTFVQTIRHLQPHGFGNGKQHDVHEFFTYLFESFSKQVAEQFSWDQTSHVKCNVCAHESTRTESCTVLTLPIGNARKMSQCIADYCAEEQLSQQDLWKCGKCNLQVPALKKLTFGPRLPATLVVQLKRFGNQQAAQKKINAVVEFDKVISLSETGPLYELQSVIYHTGQSLHAGHYTCAVRATLVY